MRHYRSVLLTTLAALMLCGLALAQDGDLQERVQRLRAEGRYDLALDLLEDHEKRGTTFSPALQWERAQLVTDPDRFDRLAQAIAQQLEVDDPLRATITLARAQEHFARGRYQTAAEYLRSIPPDLAKKDARIALFLGMAAQAIGEVRNADRAYASVPSNSSSFAAAQALLAELSLREGNLDRAEESAKRALKADGDAVGSQALLVLARIHDQRDQEGERDEVEARLLREFSSSAEAAWLRETRAGRAAQTPVPAPRLTEVEAPSPRPSFALQFGAFHDRSLALRMARTLEGKIESLRIELDRSTEPAWYRVVGGQYPTRSQADSARQKLSAQKIDSVILTPGRGGR